MGALSAMSGLLGLQLLPHEATQPLNCGLANVATPTSPCAPPKLGCSGILDTTAVISDVGLHVPSGGGGGDGER